jgi:hypothetical protein
MSLRLIGITLWAGRMPGHLRRWFVGRLPSRPWTFRVRLGRFAIEITRDHIGPKGT